MSIILSFVGIIFLLFRLLCLYSCLVVAGEADRRMEMQQKERERRGNS